MAKNKLSILNKIIFLLNNVFAIALVISFFLPNLLPEKYGVLSLLSLLTPALIIINFIFVIFWTLLGFKKQLILSFFVLLLSLIFIPSVYKFYHNSDVIKGNSLNVMTYNVRKFNKYKWLKIENIESKISDFINNESPDILALQEYRNLEDFKLNYPYFYNHIKKNNVQSGLVIYSKFPIINKGSISYNSLSGDAIYIDIVKKIDTIRLYNFRLASTGVIPDKDYFGHENSETLIKRLTESFKIHQEQVDTITYHIEHCKYKVILTGDLNNTAYSWDYKNMKNKLQDSFLEAGKGFGKTYEFKKIPLRIDYIFADKNMKIINHKNYKNKFSDHYPVSAIIEL